MSVVVRVETFDLSGFGGGYEDTCQRMLWRGVAYLAECQPPLEMWRGASEFSGVFGLLRSEGEELEALEAAVTAGEEDVTGAMHHQVMLQLWYIHRHGLDKWREHWSETEPSYVWEGELWKT